MTCYEIWSEGAILMEGIINAHYWGKFEAESFKEAVYKLAETHSGFKSCLTEYQGKLFHWGCQLFDNETDARKFAG